MKLFRLLNRLQKSTKMTLLACACLLVTTAMILLFLMFFPVTPKEKHIITMSPLSTEQQPDRTTETYPQMEFNWDDVPQTLSTWSAGVNGFSRSLDEFKKTEPETTQTSVSSFTVETASSTVMTEITPTESTEENTESGDAASDQFTVPPMPQTNTETILPEPATSTPEETMPTDVTEPDPVAPPAPEPEEIE